MTNTESIAALTTVTPHIPALHRKVLFAVGHLKSATVKEVVEKTGLPRLTVGARLTELKQAGFLTKTDNVREGCRALKLSETGSVVVQAG